MSTEDPEMMLDGTKRTASTNSFDQQPSDNEMYFENLCHDFTKEFYFPEEKPLFSVLQVKCPVQKKLAAKLNKMTGKVSTVSSADELP